MSLKLADLRKKSKEDLKKLLEKTKDGVRDATQELLDGSTKDSSAPGKLRRDIARIQTVLNENIVIEEESVNA